MNLFRKALASALVVAGPLAASAHAQQVSVEVDPTLAEAVGLNADDVESDLSSAAMGDLHLGDQTSYMEQMAHAAISSTKGMGADYASNPQRFVFGLSMGSAANGSGVQFSRDPEGLPEGGFAFQAMALAGLNLGVAAGDDSFLRRFVLYANGMAFSNSKEPFSADLYNYGAHLQIKLVRPPHEGPVEWGGIDLTSGFEASNYKLSLSKGLPIDAEPMTWDATGTYTITSSATSIPIELSTNLRLVFATLFAGAALDINPSGDAVSDISLTGDLVAESQGEEADVGTATVSYSARGLAGSQVPRFFGGVQINVFMVKAYGHMNIGLDNSYGGHIGVRVAM